MAVGSGKNGRGHKNRVEDGVRVWTCIWLYDEPVWQDGEAAFYAGLMKEAAYNRELIEFLLGGKHQVIPNLSILCIILQLDAPVGDAIKGEGSKQGLCSLDVLT